MTNQPISVQVSTSINQALLQRLDDWAWERRLRRADAIRQLIERGLTQGTEPTDQLDQYKPLTAIITPGALSEPSAAMSEDEQLQRMNAEIARKRAAKGLQPTET